jgi:hypothetical protein
MSQNLLSWFLINCIDSDLFKAKSCKISHKCYVSLICKCYRICDESLVLFVCKNKMFLMNNFDSW